MTLFLLPFTQRKPWKIALERERLLYFDVVEKRHLICIWPSVLSKRAFQTLLSTFSYHFQLFFWPVPWLFILLFEIELLHISHNAPWLEANIRVFRLSYQLCRISKSVRKLISPQWLPIKMRYGICANGLLAHDIEVSSDYRDFCYK